MGYNVPNVAGVPALLGGFNPVAAVPLVLGDLISLANVSIAPQWGIFLDGAPVVLADNVVSMDARQEFVAADFQIEGGKFESYNKVYRPFDVRFRFSTGGSAAKRSAMVASVKAIIGDFNLYTCVTPDDVWESVSLVHIGYHRDSQNGVGLLVMDVWGWQIVLQNGNLSSLTNTANPASADPSVSTPNPVSTPNVAASTVDSSPYIGGIGHQ